MCLFAVVHNGLQSNFLLDTHGLVPSGPLWLPFGRVLIYGESVSSTVEVLIAAWVLYVGKDYWGNSATRRLHFLGGTQCSVFDGCQPCP